MNIQGIYFHHNLDYLVFEGVIWNFFKSRIRSLKGRFARCQNHSWNLMFGVITIVIDFIVIISNSIEGFSIVFVRTLTFSIKLPGWIKELGLIFDSFIA